MFFKIWSAIANLFARFWSSMSGLSFAVLRVKKYGRSERWWREQVSLIYRLWLRRLWWFHFSPRPHNSLAALVSCVVHKKGGGFSAFVSWKISWEDGRGEKLWRFVCFALGLDNIFFKNLRGKSIGDSKPDCVILKFNVRAFISCIERKKRWSCREVTTLRVFS